MRIQGALINQLWAWEYRGKPEWGVCWDIPANFEAVWIPQGKENPFQIESRRFSDITNLRKVKVNIVDEECKDRSHIFINGVCMYCGQKLPITAPKNFGAIVAWGTNEAFLNREGEWIHTETFHRYSWGKILRECQRPTIISEGVEG